MGASLCPDSLAVFFLPPDANRYWTPESSDRHRQGLSKAYPKAVQLLRHVTPGNTYPPHICVHFDATNGTTIG